MTPSPTDKGNTQFIFLSVNVFLMRNIKKHCHKKVTVRLFDIKSDSHLPKKIVLFASLKALFILKIFKFLSRLFGHVGKTA